MRIISGTINLHAALPPSPERIATQIARPQELIFSWDQVQYDCPTLEYNFTSENCGSCAEVTPRVVSCIGFETSPAGIVCTFTVWSTVCGNVTGPGSMQSANVSLQGYYFNTVIIIMVHIIHPNFHPKISIIIASQ